ncbi:MAG: DUF308 domain-containing protein [Tannerellaceae bacterium]|nr:DUF308 domain-containing protein [Tannerellaceae bacterium]
MNPITDNYKYEMKHWWLPLVVGVLYVLFAIFLMFTPITSYIALSILFSVSIFVGGIFEIIFAFNNKGKVSNWGWYLALGIIDIILGIHLMINPGLSMAVLSYVAAFWILFRGVNFITFAFDLKKLSAGNWGWFLAFGIIFILCSLLFIWRPVIEALSIVYIVAYILMAVGIILNGGWNYPDYAGFRTKKNP